MEDKTKESSEVENKDVVTTPVEEPTVPLHEVTKLRTRAQTAELDAAELRGKLAGMEASAVKQAPAAISPLDAEIARQAAEGIEEADMAIPPSVMKADKLYEAQRRNQETEKKRISDLRATQTKSAETAKGKHDDWTEIVQVGQSLLTEGEFLDCENAGLDYGDVTYAKCKAAIERNKPKAEAAPELSEAEQKAKDAEAAKKAEEAAEVKSQEEILAEASAKVDPHTAHVASL